MEEQNKDTKKEEQTARPFLATEPSYAEYDFGHIAYIIKDTKDILKDAVYAIGLSRTSERTLLRTAIDKIEFLDKVMRDSKESLKDTKFRAYSDPNEVADEEVGCDCCKDED